MSLKYMNKIILVLVVVVIALLIFIGLCFVFINLFQGILGTENAQSFIWPLIKAGILIAYTYLGIRFSIAI